MSVNGADAYFDLRLWLVVALVTLGASRLTAQTPVAGAPAINLVGDHGVILTYNAATIPSPVPDEPWFKRSGFIDPVLTPAGHRVTDGFPADHLHQHGIMFAWTSARIDGRPTDFWNSAKREGRVQHVQTVKASDSQIIVKLRHLDITTDPPTPVIDETWQIDRVNHPTMNVFDLTSTQLCVLPGPLQIDQYHYGGLCVRGSGQWSDDKLRDGDNFVMRTDVTTDRIAANGSRPKWVAMSGEVEGQQCGIAAISLGSNFRSPQPVRLHPKMPYFCFAPMILGEFQVSDRAPYISRFRLVAFDGPLVEAAIDELCQ